MEGKKDKINLSSLTSKKIKIKEIKQNSNKLEILSKGLNLSNYNDIFVVLKNVKTRDEFICETYVNEEYIRVDLSPYEGFFSDYEGVLYIVVEDNNSYECYLPIYKNVINNNGIVEKSGTCRWYIRNTESGEIRLSSVMFNK